MTGDYAMLTCYLMNNRSLLPTRLEMDVTHRQPQTFKLNHHFSNSLVCVSINNVAVGEKYMNVWI